jgi:hypothetical protein
VFGDEPLAEVLVVVGVVGEHADNRVPRLVPHREAVGTVEHPPAFEAITPGVILQRRLTDGCPKPRYPILFRALTRRSGPGDLTLIGRVQCSVAK